MPDNDWLPGFRTALQQVLLENGTLVESHSTYGVTPWRQGQQHAMRYRNSKHSEPGVPDWCGAWKEITDLHEESWSQFQDTFSENTQNEILVAQVSCKCGFITAERLEYNTTVSDLITSVLRSASGIEADTVDVSRRYGIEDYSRQASAVKPPPCPPSRTQRYGTNAACLYRIFSESYELLYVGTTYRPWHRLGAQHRYRSAWWPEAYTYTLEWFPTRQLANAAEETAIHTEHPKYNLAGKTAPYMVPAEKYYRPPAPTLPVSDPRPDLPQCLWCEDLLRDHSPQELQGCSTALATPAPA